MKVTIDEKRGVMVVEMPINKNTPPSASGKSRVLATTGGGKSSDAQWQGKPVTINLTAYIKS